MVITELNSKKSVLKQKFGMKKILFMLNCH